MDPQKGQNTHSFGRSQGDERACFPQPKEPGAREGKPNQPRMAGDQRVFVLFRGLTLWRVSLLVCL